MNNEQIAEVVHEQNRAYCKVTGDNSQPSWDEAPEWQKSSAIAGVEAIRSGSTTKPSDSHGSWFAHKVADGWKYGPVKDPEKKEHPCMVAYDELPPEQRVKDTLFFNTAVALLAL